MIADSGYKLQNVINHKKHGEESHPTLSLMVQSYSLILFFTFSSLYMGRDLSSDVAIIGTASGDVAF